MKSPMISVLMSCYNGAQWLDESIDSVLDQTFADFEFLIVDDGSTDNSLDIIKDYAKRDARIVVLEKQNTGLADSLNYGIDHARGEWIARLDTDDICLSTRLEKQWRRAKESSDFVFVGSRWIEIDQNGKIWKTHHHPSDHERLVRNLVTARAFPPHSSAFYPTVRVRSIGGYRPRIRRAQDWDLWLRLSEIGRLTSLDEPLVKIRKHDHQISNEDAGRQQKIYSRVAMTAYWLRKYGQIDPINADNCDFYEFRDWVAAGLSRNKTFESMRYKVELKLNLRKARLSPMAFITLATQTKVDFLLFSRLLKLQLFGDRSAQQFASEWISHDT